jgi:hypothetical protein
VAAAREAVLTAETILGRRAWDTAP